MAPSSIETYRPSGFFRVTTIAIMLGAAVAGIGVAWLYQALIGWIPFIYVNILICVAFGAALGAAGMFAVKKGHCRNLILAGVLALPLAAVPLASTYYWEYRSVVGKVAEKQGMSVDEVKQELTISQFLELKQKVGWKLDKSSSSVNGAMVLVVWGVEALIVLGFALFMTVGAVRETYCETCNEWCKSEGYAVYGVGRTDAKPLVDAGDLDKLAAISSSNASDRTINLTMEIASCARCKETAFLSVIEKRQVTNKRKTEEKKFTMLRYAVLRGAAKTTAMERLAGVTGQKLPAVG